MWNKRLMNCVILAIAVVTIFCAGCSDKINEKAIDTRVVISGSGVDMAHTVKSVQTTEILGDGDYEEHADGIFLIVNLEIENLGTEPVYYDTGVRLIDSNGREYYPDDDAEMSIDTGFYLDTIYPGSPLKAQFGFDVPKGETFTLQINRGVGWGDWSTNPVSVDIGST